MADQDTATPPNSASSRVETAAPPRMTVAAPPRVATMSTNITAPNVVQRMPFVHQHHTHNKNPFQVLADDEDNEDNYTVVASNCSPPSLVPALSRVLVRPPVHVHAMRHVLPTNLALCQPQLPPRWPHLPAPSQPQIPLSQRPWIPPACSPPLHPPQLLVIVPPVHPTTTASTLPTIAHNLQPQNKQALPLAPTMAPTSHVIDPNDNHHNQPTRQSTLPPQRSTRIINTQRPDNILLEVIHHVMQLKAAKLATKSQWTGLIMDIKEVCFGVIHPVTKQTIT
jgi:hypothetical protein